MTVMAGWIANGWIYSDRPEQNARWWVHNNWIYGPVGAADTDARYWIAYGWIYGPVGSEDTTAEFHIRDETIFGPTDVLPFASDPGSSSGTGE